MIPSELPRPLNDDDFERMCADVYAEVFQSRRPQQFGRRGQSQSGIDVIIRVDDDLVAVQAKRYNTKKFGRTIIESEIRKADQSDLNIRELLIATTASSDNRVLSWVEKISAHRQKQGLFKVTIEFWEDITAHIRRYEVLSRKYDIRHAAEVRRESQQHMKDVEALRKVFSALNVPILEQHIHEFPSVYRFDTALLYDRFFEVYHSIDLIFQSPELRRLIDQFAQTWSVAMPQEGKDFYQDTSIPWINRFQSTGEQYRLRTYARAPAVFKELETSIAEFASATRELLLFVSQNFPEIDIAPLGRPIGAEIAGFLQELRAS